MNENHKLENILTGIGSEPVPDDIHPLAESIMDEFRQGLAAGPASSASEPQDTNTAALQESSQRGDDAMISQDSTQPTVRLVPDVPTELADGVSCEGHLIEQPPSRRHAWRFVTMFQSKKGCWSAAAAVAAAVILAVGFWPGRPDHGSGSAFAAAIEQFQKAKTIVCRISTTTPVPAGTMSLQQTGKLHFSTEYGSRCEMLMNGAPMLIQYAPLQGPTTCVTPLSGTYTVTDTDAVDQGAPRGNPPDAFILALAQLKGRASRELGRKSLDGVEVLGYEIPGQMLGLGHSEGVRSELWIDAETYLPVRYVAEIPVPQATGGGVLQIVYDQFEWDTPLDPSLFVPDIPADYTRLDASAPAPDEAALIKGLGNYAELAGKYPPTMDPSNMVTDLASALGARLGAALARGEKAPDQQALMQKGVEIGSGFAFYQNLARDGRSPEYYGKTVSPGQADAVLLRWELTDGQSRVIYGDLRVETVPN